MVLSGSTLTKIVQSSVGNLRVVFVHRLVLILYVARDRSLFRGGGSIIFKRGKRGGGHTTHASYGALLYKALYKAKRVSREG